MVWNNMVEKVLAYTRITIIHQKIGAIKNCFHITGCLKTYHENDSRQGILYPAHSPECRALTERPLMHWIKALFL
jgi:hypothetical protein